MRGGACDGGGMKAHATDRQALNLHPMMQLRELMQALKELEERLAEGKLAEVGTVGDVVLRWGPDGHVKADFEPGEGLAGPSQGGPA